MADDAFKPGTTSDAPTERGVVGPSLTPSIPYDEGVLPDLGASSIPEQTFDTRQRTEQRLFDDRRDAGRDLGQALSRYAGRNDLIVVGLPRGGVPVAFEVARRLNAPLDVFVVRKLGVPGEEELAMGAIASGGAIVLHRDMIRALRISETDIQRVISSESEELARRESLFRGERPPAELEGRTAILVDDGLATGSTMLAAALAVRSRKPARLIAAVPVGAPETCAYLRTAVDEMVCLRMPESFFAVGIWYRDFAPTTDDEVRTLLRLQRPNQ